jgi:peptide deformylase
MLTIETGTTNKILRTHCRVVTDFDENLVKFIAEMEETMAQEDPETGIRGVGLAANQVGDLRRILLITLNVGERKKQKILPMINPEITWVSPQKVSMEEGCLSVPGIFEYVSRPARVQVKWQDLNEIWHERKLGKWDARILLHEIDHLDGTLFIDYQKKS